jgi:hypothetical protein
MISFTKDLYSAMARNAKELNLSTGGRIFNNISPKPRTSPEKNYTTAKIHDFYFPGYDKSPRGFKSPEEEYDILENLKDKISEAELLFLKIRDSGEYTEEELERIETKIKKLKEKIESKIEKTGQ